METGKKPILIFPSLLLLEKARHLSGHRWHCVVTIGLLQFNSDTLILRVDRNMSAKIMKRVFLFLRQI